MAKFVIHKKGFHYTDDAYIAEDGKRGSVVATYASLAKAKAAKLKADISSIQGLAGMFADEFYGVGKDYNQVTQKLKDYYQSEFGLTLRGDCNFEFPSRISKGQAAVFLDILGISFHDIVEYGDDEELDPEVFNLDEDGLGEF